MLVRNETINSYFSFLTVRAFDYCGSHEMTDRVIHVMELTHKQIKELRKDFNDTQVYASTGIILMNGHID